MQIFHWFSGFRLLREFELASRRCVLTEMAFWIFRRILAEMGYRDFRRILGERLSMEGLED